jgi:hypothetical protein
MTIPLRVGDVVRVSRACLGNLEHSLAVVVEVYDRQALGLSPHEDLGVTLQFPNGQADGFSSADLAIFGVARVGHRPRLAAYRWRSAMQLLEDYRRGLFAEVWSREWI